MLEVLKNIKKVIYHGSINIPVYDLEKMHGKKLNKESFVFIIIQNFIIKISHLHFFQG